MRRDSSTEINALDVASFHKSRVASWNQILLTDASGRKVFLSCLKNLKTFDKISGIHSALEAFDRKVVCSKIEASSVSGSMLSTSLVGRDKDVSIVERGNIGYQRGTSVTRRWRRRNRLSER